MSEMKRVEITTIPTSQKKKKVAWKQNTYRFVVTLGESTSVTCPEYCFTDLVKSEKLVEADPFEDPNEDKALAAIAQKFEAKYGPKGFFSGTRKRTQEMDDYYDPGEGYDEDDPFIDNTEAHDEVIPAAMTTQHGGFYINQGKLDFIFLDENSVDEFTHVKKKKKKKPLDSDSGEESSAAVAKKFKAMKRKKLSENKDGESKKQKKHSNSDGGQVVLKKKKIKITDTPKMQKSTEQTPPPASDGINSPIPPSMNVATPSLSSNLPAAATPTRSGTPVTAPSSGLENGSKVLAKVAAELNEDADFVSTPDAVKDDSSSKSDDEAKGDQPAGEKTTPLPTQLPAELLDAIESIKREAKLAKENKVRFFSDTVNKLLLDIELRSSGLPWGSKTAIYGHLSDHLPCGKYTIQRRAKKLSQSQQEGQMKLPMQKLKDAINEVMTGLQEQHELEVQRVKMESEQKEETDVKEDGSTESEGEEKADGRKKPRGPRKKFQWNSEIRNLLLDIVSAKVKLFSLHKSRFQSGEEYIKAFLDTEIKPMWPQGWMQTRTLFKESRKAHEELTKGAVQQNKQKKSLNLSDVPSPSVETTPPAHVSKTESVIEISSFSESENDKSVVIVGSQPSIASSAAPTATNTLTLTSTSQPSSSAASVLPPPASGQMSKPSFKPTTASASHSATPATTVATSKGTDSLASPSSNSSVKRIIPIPVVQPLLSQVNSKTLAGSKSVTSATGASLASTGPAQNVAPTQSSTQQMSSLQHKSNTQQKPSQQQTVNSTQQQKSPHHSTSEAAMKSSSSSPALSNKDGPNSAWPSMNKKSINPVVSVNRISENLTQKLPHGSKVSGTSPQPSQTRVSQSSHSNNSVNTAVFKTDQTGKKQGAGSATFSNVMSVSDALLLNKSSQLPPRGKSSKQETHNAIRATSDGQQEYLQYLQKNSIIPGPQTKTSTNATSNSSSNVKVSNIFNNFSNPPNARATDFPGWSSHGKSGNNKYSSSSQNIMPSPISSARHSPMTSSPPSNMASSLLNITTSTPLSRSSTPSPQKSPISPEGNAGLSLYEQIKYQIHNQEAMEDQALKNLALALKFGGSGVSNR